MTIIEITKKIDGVTITVKVERSVDVKKAYADGYNVETGKEAYEAVTMTIEKNGQKVICRPYGTFMILDKRFDKITMEKTPQAYARFGDTYISEKLYNDIKSVLDEAMKKADAEVDAEYAEVKAMEKAKAEKAEIEAEKTENLEQSRNSHKGWCNKCHSYCCGDCEA